MRTGVRTASKTVAKKAREAPSLSGDGGVLSLSYCENNITTGLTDGYDF